MKRFVLLPMAALLACLLAPSTASAGWSGSLGRYPDAWNLNGHLGIKILDSDDWAPADRATSLGIDWDYAGRQWPIGLTAAFYYARASGSEDGLDADSTTMELHAGVRKVWYSRNNGTGWLRPYVGAGLAGAYASADASPGTERSGYGFGGWLGGGAYVNVYGRLNLGLDLRYSTIAADLDGITVDAGGLRASFVIGLHESDR
jgi:opacity protein-like surface antigen